MSEAQPRDGSPAADDTGQRARRPESATRDHMANERTLLAWSRTGIAIVALGFVVARFGLLIRELAVRVGQTPTRATGISTVFGASLVLCGALLVVFALVRYLRVGQQIERGEYRWSPVLGILLAALLVIASILLTIYLLLTA